MSLISSVGINKNAWNAWCVVKHISCVVTRDQVILQKSEVESMVHSPGDYILLSADKYEIKVMLMSLAVSCFRFWRAKILFYCHVLAAIPEESIRWCKHCAPSAGLAFRERNQLQVFKDAISVRWPQHQPSASPAVWRTLHCLQLWPWSLSVGLRQFWDSQVK